MESVSWTEMQYGTQEDYEVLVGEFDRHAKAGLVDNLCNLVRLLEGPTLGYQCDRYSHSLQAATRALRNGESCDMVVGALLHDVADTFAPEHHSAAAATILAPYVDDETHWVVKHHGLFQGYYYFHHLGGDRNTRDLFEDSPHFERCVAFCAEYDQNSFDPKYETLALEDFRPLMDEVFNRPSRINGMSAASAGA